MLNTEFSPWPSFTQREADKANEILLSNKVNYWTGVEGRSFESEFAKWTESEHAIAVANGTLALELALIGLGVGQGDEVIVTPRTFIASISCVVRVGAIPVFVDVDRDTQNITVENIEKALSSKTKAVICVHLAGWPCEMDSIMELAKEKNFFVIEDCAQAHGAKYKGRSVGSWGHVAAWSFCQDKIMTTAGEGGMVTTNDRALWERMWDFKDHGKSWTSVYEKSHPPGFRWVHDSFGSNYRLSEISSAIGRIQIEYMNEWHPRRVANIEKIWETARKISSLRVPEVPSDIVHAAYKAYVFLEYSCLKDGIDKEIIMTEFAKEGVPCYSGSCSEVYLETAFDGMSFKPKERLPVAKELGETSLMFLVHPTLTDAEIDKTCEVIIKVMNKFSK